MGLSARWRSDDAARVEFSKIKGEGIKNALLFAVFSRLFLHIMVKNNGGVSENPEKMANFAA